LFFSRSQAKQFDRLVQPHLQTLFRFAHRLTGNSQDAEDLVQDVMVKLYPRTDELAQVADLRPWLNRVLYRQFVDQTRRDKRRADQPLSDHIPESEHGSFMDRHPGETLGPLGDMEQERSKQLLDEALNGLSPDQRALIVMHDVDGWRQEDIAQVLEVAPGTIKSRLHRCRQALRERLSQKMEPKVSDERVPGKGRGES